MNVQDNTAEEWCHVPDYEDLYEVSSLGRVRRGHLRHRGGYHYRILRRPPNPDGYLRVCLCRNGRCKAFGVHILVALAFLGPCPEGYEVNHKDMNEGNPRIENLEYVTSSGNLVHAYANGRVPCRGVRHSHKLTVDEVEQIRCQYMAGVTNKEMLGRKYGVSGAMIGKIVRGENWKHPRG